MSTAKEKAGESKYVKLPDHIYSIEKTNTYPNPTEETLIVEPSEQTKKLLETNKITITNPEVIKLLNETNIKPSPIAIGYRAEIYLGRWPLNYKSDHTDLIDDYQQINENDLNNLNGDAVERLSYIQTEDREVKGALMNKVEQPTMVRNMILHDVQQRVKAPLSFTTKVGKNSKSTNYYNVPADQHGFLHAYIPAINEKGQILSGEVYVQLKGSKSILTIKNITKHGIGAWIPLQDHITLSFTLK